MDCKWFNNDFETCTSGDCPFCADFCPVTENQEVCRYSDLDDTETMLRRCLDAEKEDSREAIQALAEENKDLKKQLEKAKAERDAYKIYFDDLSSKPDCNTCDDKDCRYRPRVGAIVRVNCPFWCEKED